MLTIGKLAKIAGIRTSALRYYETEGLLTPDGRSDSGYRLYHPQAADRLRLIQRAQRLGFSLSNIRTLLNGYDHGDLSDDALIQTAESRYLALDKQLTELLAQQHELQLFLRDLHQNHAANPSFAQMLQRVCANPPTQPTITGALDWLRQYAGCALTTEAGQAIVEQLQGQHVHIWQEGETYSILVVSADTAVHHALTDLAQLESSCQTHAHTHTELIYDDEGFLLRVTGPHAFIFARLFLALES